MRREKHLDHLARVGRVSKKPALLSEQKQHKIDVWKISFFFVAYQQEPFDDIARK